MHRLKEIEHKKTARQKTKTNKTINEDGEQYYLSDCSNYRP